MSPKLPQDELLERYAQAKAAQPDGLPDAPSAALHERIMQAAREQASTINSVAPCADSKPATGLKSLKNAVKKPAANDRLWNIKFVASLAVMGLSGLLWYQFEHGTPQEQEAAKSAKPSAPVVAAAPAPTPVPASESATSTARVAPAPAVLQAPASNAAPATAATSRKEAQASKPSEAKIAETEMASTSAAAPPAPTAAPSLPQFSQADKALVDIPSRRTVPNIAQEPSLQRSLENPQAVTSPSKLLAAIETKDATAVRQALAQGASPNARTPEGNPALTLAVTQRWNEGVRILLVAGADRSAKNTKGHTAADVALDLGYADMAELLAASK